VEKRSSLSRTPSNISFNYCTFKNNFEKYLSECCFFTQYSIVFVTFLYVVLEVVRFFSFALFGSKLCLPTSADALSIPSVSLTLSFICIRLQSLADGAPKSYDSRKLGILPFSSSMFPGPMQNFWRP
jgi:hypothetical protein